MSLIQDYHVQDGTSLPSLSYKLQNLSAEQTATVVLIAGVATADTVKAALLKNDNIVSLNNDAVINVNSVVNLAVSGLHDAFIAPLVKEFKVEVLSDSNQLKQGQKPLVIATQNRFSEIVENPVKAKFNEETGSWTYTVNQAIASNQFITLELLPSILVKVTCVYNS